MEEEFGFNFAIAKARSYTCLYACDVMLESLKS